VLHPLWDLLLSQTKQIKFSLLVELEHTALFKGLILLTGLLTILVITSPYYEFTNQILHRIDYSSINQGSAQPLITQGDLKKVVVLVPGEETLSKFEEFAGSLMSKWEANNEENVKLVSLRDTLLPKLMSGELMYPTLTFKLLN